jgi:PAS domain S-box-containing protein
MPGADDWQALFRAVFDASRNPMTLLDERLVRVDVNPATCALYGVGRDELVGRRADSMVLGGRLPETVPTFAEVVARGSGTGRATVVRPDGDLIDVEFAVQAGLVGGRHLVLLVVTEETPADEAEPADGDGLAPLTERERDIVHRLALGLTSREIAAELVLSHETVRTHVRNAMGKVGARTRAQLVAVALADRHLAAPA